MSSIVPPKSLSSQPTRKPKQQGIYAITCSVTGEQYVGSSVDIARRWRSHRSHLKTGKRLNAEMQEAWDKHGGGTFSCEIVEIVETESNLVIREQYHVTNLKPSYNKHPIIPRPKTGRQKTDIDDEAKYWKHITKQDNGCWIWDSPITRQGNASPQKQFLIGDKRVMVHRFAYERFIGTLNPGEYLRRICRSLDCVNPHHFEVDCRHKYR